MVNEATFCAACGVPLEDDAAAIRHLNEALEMERAVAQQKLEMRDDSPDPSWTEDAEGYVVAPLDWKGAK